MRTMKNVTRVRTGASGNQTGTHPSRAAIAPDAPIIATVAVAFVSTKARVAPAPRGRRPGAGNAEPVLHVVAEIQRKSMFPARWTTLPCRTST